MGASLPRRYLKDEGNERGKGKGGTRGERKGKGETEKVRREGRVTVRGKWKKEEREKRGKGRESAKEW